MNPTPPPRTALQGLIWRCNLWDAPQWGISVSIPKTNEALHCHRHAVFIWVIYEVLIAPQTAGRCCESYWLWLDMYNRLVISSGRLRRRGMRILHVSNYTGGLAAVFPLLPYVSMLYWPPAPAICGLTPYRSHMWTYFRNVFKYNQDVRQPQNIWYIDRICVLSRLWDAEETCEGRFRLNDLLFKNQSKTIQWGMKQYKQKPRPTLKQVLWPIQSHLQNTQRYAERTDGRHSEYGSQDRFGQRQRGTETFNTR